MIANQSYFLSIFWACVGGAVVVVGLLLETLADKERFKDIKSFRRWHCAKRFGEWAVIIGVLAETVDAGWTAYGINKNNPLNQPISTTSAFIKIVVKGTKNVESDSYTNGLSYAAWLFLCSDVIRFKDVMVLTNSPPWKSGMVYLPSNSVGSVVSLTASNMVFKYVNTSGSPVWEPMEVPGLPYLESDRFFVTSGYRIAFGINGKRSPNGENLQFQELPDAPGGFMNSHEYDLQFLPAASSGFDIPVGKKAKTINDIKAILISLKFLPPGSEIIGGWVRVDINNFKKIFWIPPQTNDSLEDFQIITTNIATTFE